MQKNVVTVREAIYWKFVESSNSKSTTIRRLFAATLLFTQLLITSINTTIQQMACAVVLKKTF